MSFYSNKNEIAEQLENPAMRGYIKSIMMGALVSFSTFALAAPVMNDVSYQVKNGEQVQVRIDLSEPVAKPVSFTIDNPARLAIDLPGVHLATPKKLYRVDTGVVRDVRSVEAGGKTRVVVDMVRLVPYSITTEGSSLIVSFSENQAQPKSIVATNGVAGTASAKKAAAKSLKAVDFRRGVDGQGQLLLTLSDPMTAIDIDERMGKIYVKLLGNRVPENLERRLDVTDFATPVTTIDTVNTTDGAAVTIATHGEYQYMAYQTGDTYTVEVRPMTKAEQEAKKEKYTGEKLSLNFQNIEVRAVLQLLADFTGLNIVASDTVQGNITLRLKNVPWDQALDIVLKTRGLGMRKNGNVIMVAPNAELAAMEKQELDSKKQIQELAPLKTRYYTVNYAKASDIAKLLKSDKNSILTSRGSVTVDERTNTLMVLETDEKQAELESLIKQLDIPVRQVLIESRIVIASSSFGKELGSRIGFSEISQNPPRTGSGTLTTSGSITGTNTTIQNVLGGNPMDATAFSPSLSDRLNTNFPATGTNAAKIALAILGKDYLVDLELSALQTEGKGEVLSNPRVVTANQKQAKIEQGVDIPYETQTTNTNTGVSSQTVLFKQALLTLTVTPQITPDDRVIMDLEVQKDSVGAYYKGQPSIDKRKVQTQVLVGNGETVVLGGIYEQTSADGMEKVPLLGDIPLIGNLFRHKTNTQTKNELLIFVSPKILKEGLQAGLQ